MLSFREFKSTCNTVCLDNMVHLTRMLTSEGCYNQYGWFSQPHGDGVMVIPGDMFKDRTPIFVATVTEYYELMRLAEVFDARR